MNSGRSFLAALGSRILFARVQLTAALIGTLVAVGLFLFLSHLNAGGDWSAVLRPAARNLLAGSNPYNEQRFLSPPWAFLFLVPLAWLSEKAGSALFAMIGVLGYLIAFYKLRVKPLSLFFLVANPAFFAVLVNPNFDWAVALGIVMPPQVGLFFVLIKPQISAPLAFYWLVESWRRGGWRETARVFAPVSAAYILSIVLFGPWILHMGGAVNSLSNTANVWPWGLLAGFALVALSLRDQEKHLALAAGPFISPYLAPYSWLPASLGFSGNTFVTAALWLAFWLAWLITIGVL